MNEKFSIIARDPIIGAKIKLNGTVKYWQDFCAWENDFEGMEFTAVDVVNGSIVLRAPGYGVVGDAGDYGNGAIFISPEELKLHGTIEGSH